MTRVLLVTDDERVQKLFEDLEKNGLLRLHAVASLLQGDDAIAGFAPEFTFVQSRISGLSGDIVLRHLKKLLPAEGKTVLLAVDPEDAAQARKQGARCVELSGDTDAVAAQVTAALQGSPEPVKKPPARRRQTKKAGHVVEAWAEAENAPEAPLAAEPREGDEEVSPPPPPGEGRRKGTRPAENASVSHGTGPHPCPSPGGRRDAVPQQPGEEPLREAEELCPASPAAPDRAGDSVPTGQRGTAAAPTGPDDTAASGTETGDSATGAFAEVAEQEREQEPEPEPEPEPQDAASFAEMMQRATERQSTVPVGGVEEKVEPAKGAAVQPEHPSNLHYHPKERPVWSIPVLLIVVLVPLFYLLSPQKKSPGVPPASKPMAPRAPAPSPVTLPPAPVPPPVPQAGPGQAPRPEPGRSAGTVGTMPRPVQEPAVLQSLAARQTPPTPAARAVAPEKPARPAPPAQPPKAAGQAGQNGLPELPPFLREVTLDPMYSKGHPGWERYIGARAEYKLYKQGGLYKAIQVIALTGQTVPDEIFKKVLQEFGGMENYQLQSTEKKQHFLIDHGTGPGNIAVTVYRRINDRRVKGVVLYYR